MKWLTYSHSSGQLRGGILLQNYIVDLEFLLLQGNKDKKPPFPTTLLELIEQSDQWKENILLGIERISKLFEDNQWGTIANDNSDLIIPFDKSYIAAPLPRPSSIRDSYSFEQHVLTARKKRGLEMVKEWYDFPVFYFSNHQAITGPEAEIEFPSSSNKWDFELEVGVVIGKKGKNIPRTEAFNYIFGLTVMNDWSARDIQAEEVKVGLGPAKAKDFATSIGPFIVTAEDWRDRLEGEQINLKMEAFINGEKVSSGNLNQLYWSIPQIIERVSQDCTIYPGDIIGTGTVGTGCLLEHQEPNWLKGHDEVKLSVERLGVLTNKIKPRGGE